MRISQDITDDQRLRLNCSSICKLAQAKLARFLYRTSDKDIARLDNRQRIGMLRFEISSDKLNELLLKRQVCAADIRCLDAQSNQGLKMLCLKTCLRSASCYSESKQDIMMERIDIPAAIKQQNMILDSELAGISETTAI